MFNAIANKRTLGIKRKRLALLIVTALAAGAGGSVQAFSFDTGDSDLQIRWDNSIRYNAGMRAQSQSAAFMNSPGNDETENSFDKGDIVTDRLDLVTEFDLIYKQRTGFRVSAAGWYDGAYGSYASPNPAIQASSGISSSNYADNRYDGYTRRYILGPSGEFLDAFVFTGFDVGSTSFNLKLGQHNVYWGESLYSITNSIAYSQGPVDTIKAATSPGAEAKELFLPLPQFSMQAQLTGTLSFAAQYLFDWKPFRLIPGGTFFATGAGSDGSRSDYGASAAQTGGLIIPNGPDIGPNHDSGNWGASLRWSPDWLNGTAGLYYRKFDEKLPWSITQINPTIGIPTAIRLSYARGTELWGLSLSKTIDTISVGSELSYRKNTALNSTLGFPVLAADASYDQAEGARGDTLHGLINGIYLLPETRLWKGGSLTAELSYEHLDKVTSNPISYVNPEGVFYAKGYACPAGYGLKQGCVTDNAWGMTVNFTPQWPQALPSWDLSMPMNLSYGLKGNGASLGGTNEGAYTWSIGLTGEWRQKYDFSLSYIGSHTNYQTDPVTGVVISQNGAGAVQNSHGWVSFTFKTTL